VIAAHKNGVIHKQDARVSLEVNSGGSLHDLQTLDCNICLIGETKAHKIEHLATVGRAVRIVFSPS
jgi:hypothetical protein